MFEQDLEQSLAFHAEVFAAQQKGMQIQTLIFDKSKFSKQEAKKWAKDNNFKGGGVDETGDSYRIRQKDPSSFQEGFFRTISLKDGVKAVVGKPK